MTKIFLEYSYQYSSFFPKITSITIARTSVATISIMQRVQCPLNNLCSFISSPVLQFMAFNIKLVREMKACTAPITIAGILKPPLNATFKNRIAHARFPGQCEYLSAHDILASSNMIKSTRAITHSRKKNSYNTLVGAQALLFR